MVALDRLERIYNQLELLPRARAILAQSAVQPAQPPRNKAGNNVRGRYPSAKMGVTIQFSSHKLELPAILELEYDPSVVAYWESPPPIRLSYALPNGRNYATDVSPTFLVVAENAVYYEEWKQEESLVELTRKMPNRYVQVDGDGGRAEGKWRCPPGEESAAVLGFGYRVRSSSEINWSLQANLTYLQTYFATGGETLTVDENLAEVIVATTRAELGITLADLRERVEREFSELGAGYVADAINILIVKQRLFVNLKVERLAEPARAHVYAEADLAYLYTVMSERIAHAAIQPAPRTIHLAVGAPLLWDGREWAVANLGATETSLIAPDKQLLILPNDKLERLIREGTIAAAVRGAVVGLTDEGRHVLATASVRDREIASQRYRAIEPLLNRRTTQVASATGGDLVRPIQFSERTLFRWLRQYRDGVVLYGDGFIGLLDQHKKRGRRGSRYPAEITELTEQFIKNYYETLTHTTRRAVYSKLLATCHEKGIQVPSYNYFCAQVKRRPLHEQALRRTGRRAAYKLEAFYWEITPTTPRHGSRFMEIAHMDHTESDVELVLRDGTTRMGKAWTTSLTEATTRTELVTLSSYERPNKATPLLALRMCVERWGRLPEILVVDNGADLRSIDLDVFAARYHITIKVRPAAKARYGSVGERWFGSTNTQFLHTLQGNTQLMRFVRQVTKRENPRERAIWDLPALHAALQYWAYEIYDQLIHSTLGMSPRDARLLSIAESGAREHTLIPYDEDFIRETMPSIPRRTAKVQPSLGVKVNNIYYWHDSMRGPDVVDTKVPVRYDPSNIGRTYAFIKGTWVECISDLYPRLAGHSVREAEQATEAIKQKHRERGTALTINARILGDFLNSVEGAELLLEQRLKDAEARATQAFSYQLPTPGTSIITVAPATANTRASNTSNALPAGVANASVSAHEQALSSPPPPLTLPISLPTPPSPPAHIQSAASREGDITGTDVSGFDGATAESSTDEGESPVLLYGGSRNIKAASADHENLPTFEDF